MLSVAWLLNSVVKVSFNLKFLIRDLISWKEAASHRGLLGFWLNAYNRDL